MHAPATIEYEEMLPPSAELLPIFSAGDVPGTDNAAVTLSESDLRVASGVHGVTGDASRGCAELGESAGG